MTKYDSPRATWHVTTEGDCEGKTTKDLGVHHGSLPDIALALAPSAFYSLQFKQMYVTQWSEVMPAESVNVSFAIESGTWDMPSAQRVTWFRELLHGFDKVCVSESKYYACVKLERPLDDATKQQALVKSAKAKLSREELAALYENIELKACGAGKED